MRKKQENKLVISVSCSEDRKDMFGIRNMNILLSVASYTASIARIKTVDGSFNAQKAGEQARSIGVSSWAPPPPYNAWGAKLHFCPYVDNQWTVWAQT